MAANNHAKQHPAHSGCLVLRTHRLYISCVPGTHTTTANTITTGERATDALRESLLMGGPADAPFGMPQPGMGGAGAGGAVGMEAGGGGGGASAMERYT